MTLHIKIWCTSWACFGWTQFYRGNSPFFSIQNILKQTNKQVKSQKLHPKAAEMQAACINGASNNVPCLKGKGPLLPFANGPLLSPLATEITLQHTFNTSSVCHFYLCLPRETKATGVPRLILLPHVNHQHQQQIISTSYSFGTCSHNVCWVGLVPASPMKIDLLLKLQLQSSNTKEGTLIALHFVFPLQ